MPVFTSVKTELLILSTTLLPPTKDGHITKMVSALKNKELVPGNGN